MGGAYSQGTVLGLTLLPQSTELSEDRARGQSERTEVQLQKVKASLPARTHTNPIKGFPSTEGICMKRTSTAYGTLK